MTITDVRLLCTPYEGYHRLVAYGKKKANLSWDILVLQSLASGFWIGMAGHVATITAAAFYVEGALWRGGVTKIVYGTFFPLGFMAIAFTGAELFTGNSCAMMVWTLHNKFSKQSLLDLGKNWLATTLLNYLGCVFVAFFFSWLTDSFGDAHIENKEFIESLCHKKMTWGWGIALVQAIGCNILVCLATFTVLMLDAGFDKIAAIWFFISTFCFANFEHVVANFYTLSTCVFFRLDGRNYGEIIYNNFIPVWIGNTIGGALLGGVVWWYCLRPHGLPPDAAADKSIILPLRKVNSGKSSGKSQSYSLTLHPHVQPADCSSEDS